MRTEAFGIDVSSHNESVSVEKLKAFKPKIQFAWARTGESYAWQDPKFNYFRDIFENKLTIWFGGYHILYPGENGAQQARNMVRIAGKSLRGYACDTELVHGQSATKIRTEMGNFCQELLMMGLPAWGYCAPLWARSWLLPDGIPAPEWMGKIKWWLAQYLTFPNGYLGYEEHPGPLSAMPGVKSDRIYIHQTTSSIPGADIGQPAGSPRLDGNRMLINFLGDQPGTPKETPDPEVMLFEALCLVTGLRIRTSPEKTNSNSTGDYCKINQRYPVYEVNGDWYRIGSNRWACSREGGTDYFKKVESGAILTDAQRLDLLWWAHPELH